MEDFFASVMQLLLFGGIVTFVLIYSKVKDLENQVYELRTRIYRGDFAPSDHVSALQQQINDLIGTSDPEELETLPSLVIQADELLEYHQRLIILEQEVLGEVLKT